MNFNWIALFSHTGSDIYNISEKIGRWPDKIITNKPPGSEDLHEGIISRFASETGQELIYTADKPTTTAYRQLFNEDSLITLHGWMRVIPGSICEEYNIYNLHPGLIRQYPELKGKDPQKKVVSTPDEERYKKVGCVIHKTVKEVDDGEIIMERSSLNVYPSEGELTRYLHEMGTQMWVDFLNLYADGKLDEIL